MNAPGRSQGIWGTDLSLDSVLWHWCLKVNVPYWHCYSLEVPPASAASMLNVYLPLLHEDACLSMWMEEEIQLHFSSLEEK